MREQHQRVEREAQPFAFDDGAQRRLVTMDRRSILLEALVVRGAGERNEGAARGAGEEHAGFLEQLARGGDVVGHGVCRGQVRQLLRGVGDAVAPGLVAVVIHLVDAAAGEDVRAAHERRVGMAAHHEHFRTARAVAQHHDSGRRPRVGDDRFAHGRQY